LRAIVYSNIYVAFVLAALTLSSYFLVPELEMRIHTVISVFLGSFILYNFHRLYKVDFIPADQLSARHEWVLKRSNYMKMAMGFALFGLMILLPNYDADTIVCLIPAGMISVGYTIPIIPSENGWTRLRDIPFTKPLIISLVVSYLTMAFPLFDQLGFAALSEPQLVQLLAERMLFLLAVTIPFELRDLHNDKNSGLKTLATKLGFDQAKMVGVISLGAWVFMLSWRFWSFGFSIFDILVGIVLLVWLAACYALITIRRTDLYYILAFEGSIMLYSLGWVLSSIFQTTA